MSKVYDEDGVELHHGDCLAVMAQMPENSIDTIITDPPYELGFMGKAWDRSGVSFRPETWQAALRVAKPGAFLLAFGGTRTWHRLACAIEDAGWELRDTIAWMFGVGFPKSANISKMIDKAAGAERVRVGRRMDVNGVPVGRDFENGKKHEGYQRPWRDKPADEQNTAWETAPATDAAKLWTGWGTSLKPAFEPIIVAMKPLDGTFAGNALKHGVAGLNIDGGRIHTEGSEAREYTVKRLKPGATLNKTGGNWRPDEGGEEYNGTTKAGRWPANLILDGEAARLLDEASGHLQSGSAHVLRRGGTTGKGMGYGSSAAGTVDGNFLYGDSGGASRFFKIINNNPASSGVLSTLCGEEYTTVENTCAGKKTASSGGNSATDGRGNKATGQFLSGTKSTTRTKTPSTTTSQISNASPPHGTTITTSENAKTIASSMGLKSDDASDAPNTNPLTDLNGGQVEPIRDIAPTVSGNISPNGEPRTGSTSTPICGSTTRHGGIEEIIATQQPPRFFYTSKASRSDRGHGNTHPTVKPTDLMKYLCKLTATPTGGVVLDPFAGSGTTLVAAREYGRPCIGIELEEDHCRIIVDRLRQGHLFGAAS